MTTRTDSSFNPVTGTRDSYLQSMTSFSGADIRAVLGGVEIGEIQQVSWSVVREKGGNFTLGDENAKSFSRGRRYIAGSLMFGFFSKEALLFGMRGGQACASSTSAGYYYEWNDNGGASATAGLDTAGMATMDPRDQELGYAEESLRAGAGSGPRREALARYADQLMPFNITLVAANEYGVHARMAIMGIEILNMESGFAIETMQADHRYSFLARELAPWVRGAAPSYRPASNPYAVNAAGTGGWQ